MLTNHEDDFNQETWPRNYPSITETRNHPNHWFNRAADLHASAGAVWHAMQTSNKSEIARQLGLPRGHDMAISCYPVYHMLCGQALEVIMKAVLVQRGIDFKKTHNLDTLVNHLGLKKSPKELALLRFYEQSIYWAGRYPIPVKCTDQKLLEHWSLASDVLTSPFSVGNMTFRKGNSVTEWANFTKCWGEYASLFKHD